MIERLSVIKKLRYLPVEEREPDDFDFDDFDFSEDDSELKKKKFELYAAS